MRISIGPTDVPNRLEGHWPPRKWSHPEWLRDSGPLQRFRHWPALSGPFVYWALTRMSMMLVFSVFAIVRSMSSRW